ncbi:hypothetical protein ACFPJ1_18310 [Kribbella qitaiheensis]|uniref:hypothetical protein n=1 Tax=Kribbella qitaiheensis TaxID=1544730 RepID=UPI003624538D
MSDYHVVEPITVLIDSIETVCSLEQTSTPDSHWTLVLTRPDGSTWTGAGQGLWTAFLELRRHLEPVGYRLCCAGAKLDAHMRGGRWTGGDIVDILSRRTLLGIRHKAFIFDYAPPAKTATVDQQSARNDRWFDTPWWRALLPGDPVH